MRDDGLSEPQGLISINDDVGLRTMNREVKKPLIIGIIMCWSPISNLKKLVQPTSVPHLSSLNALRVFSMFWVLLGHACYWAFWTIGFDNVIHVMTVTVKHWTSSVIVNATLSVDSFFYMSGFLVAYLGMKELYKKGRMNMFLYYFHRFWRLSPPYLLALIFLWHVLPYLGSGPWWVYVESYSSRKNCADYWWTNVLCTVTIDHSLSSGLVPDVPYRYQQLLA
jgi:peptidoglycan/LPS O-acetylase OafA/YrhL